MINIIRSAQRGQASFGWLHSQHTFSFGEYYNPAYMGFSVLRVINDDTVAPAAGFATHGHRNMEIISYVLQGQIAHKDSAGHERVLPAGVFQLMSAGSGIYHSEYNASNEQPLRFLQIWIRPDVLDTQPDYQEKAVGQQPGLTLVASPDGRNGTLRIRQNASLYQLMLAEGESILLPLEDTRCYYLHLLTGELVLHDLQLKPGDGASISSLAGLQAQATAGPLSALLFDLPVLAE